MDVYMSTNNVVTPATITISVSQEQAVAIRKLSLKYESVSVAQMGQKLFNSAIKNAFTPYSKAVTENAGKQWDAATKLGFDTKLSREEYVKRAATETREILAGLV